MTDKRDIVLVRVSHGCFRTIRFVKRNDKFYMVGDIDHGLSDGSVRNYKDRIETTRSEIMEQTQLAISATLRGDDGCFEIWINASFHEYLMER